MANSGRGHFKGNGQGRGSRGGGQGGFNPVFGKKAGTPLENSYRFLIPASTASKAIGKGGANTREIKEAVKDLDAEAKITIYTLTGNNQPVDNNAADRILTIQTTTECLAKILQMMQPKIQHPSLEGKKPELRMLIPSHCGSSIIGKGGEIVKKLKEETGSYIQVYKGNLPNSEESVVKVQNVELDKLVETVLKIIEAIKENKSKKPICYYDPVDQSWFEPEVETGSFMENEMHANGGQMGYGGYAGNGQWGYAAGGYGSTGYENNGYYDQSYSQGWGYDSFPAPRGQGGARGPQW